MHSPITPPPPNASAAPPAAYQELFATLAVVVITLMALTAGWIVKNNAQDDRRTIEHEGYLATLPMGWVMAQGDTTAEERLWAWNKRAPLEHLRFSTTPSTAEIPLSTVALQRNLARSQRLNTYHVLDETAVTVDGRTGYKVSFAYVEPGHPQDLPVVITGVDYFFYEADQAAVLIFTAEAPSGELNPLIPAFQRFMLSVRPATQGNTP